MSDELVKRLRGLAVHSYLGRSVIEEAADRIAQLTAERDRLREALNQSRLAFAGHVSVQSAIDLIDRAALKGESHD